MTVDHLGSGIVMIPALIIKSDAVLVKFFDLSVLRDLGRGPVAEWEVNIY